jgi:hypothetical protein
MFALPRIPASAGCLAALVVATIAPAPVAAADWQRGYLEPAIQAWMGVVTMLAEDGEREGDRHHGGHHRHGMHGGRHEHGHHGRMHAPGHPHHAHMGPPRPEGPRADAITMLQDISGRLARIERMLAARGPGGPGRGEWRGAERPEMSSAARGMMEARMKEGREKMKAAREKWEKASPEDREKMKQEWEARMKEGREKMERARAEKGERSGNADEMKQAMERFRAEAGKRMEEAKAKMDEARKRFQDMEARVKQLEAEVARMKKTAEKDD